MSAWMAVGPARGHISFDLAARVDPVVHAGGRDRADCPACLPQATHPMPRWTRPPGAATWSVSSRGMNIVNAQRCEPGLD
jgi:hypothetical protein